MKRGTSLKLRIFLGFVRFCLKGPLDSWDFSDDCEKDARYNYEDELYTGKYDLWFSCGEEGSTFVNLAAVPENREFMAVVQIQALTDADLEAGDHIFNTFEVVGDIAAREATPPEEASGLPLG